MPAAQTDRVQGISLDDVRFYRDGRPPQLIEEIAGSRVISPIRRLVRQPGGPVRILPGFQRPIAVHAENLGGGALPLGPLLPEITRFSREPSGSRERRQPRTTHHAPRTLYWRHALRHFPWYVGGPAHRRAKCLRSCRCARRGDLLIRMR